MSDLIRTVVEHVVGWPFVVIVVAALFRKPLGGLLARVEQFKGPGIEVSANSGTAAQQTLAEKTSTVDDALLGNTGLQRVSSGTKDLTRRQAEIRAFGGASDVVMLWIASIESELNDLEFTLGTEDTSKVLVRQLAMFQIFHLFEKLYRLIFGSQILLLRHFNETGYHSEVEVRPFYDSAQAEYPVFYSDYSFEMWLAFLIQQQVVHVKEDSFGISLLGREFLIWIVSNGLGRSRF